MAYQYDFGGDAVTTGEISYQFQDYCILKCETQAIDTSSFTYINWNEAIRDPSGNMWDPDTNSGNWPGTTQIKISVAGYYLVGAFIDWEYNVTGSRYAKVFKSDAAMPIEDLRTASGESEIVLKGFINCAANSYLQLDVWQSSGSTINVANRSRFWAIRVIGTP